MKLELGTKQTADGLTSVIPMVLGIPAHRPSTLLDAKGNYGKPRDSANESA